MKTIDQLSISASVKLKVNKAELPAYHFGDRHDRMNETIIII